MLIIITLFHHKSPKCRHFETLKQSNHNITIYTSPDRTDKSWTLVRREGLPMSARPEGLYYRPKVIYNALTSLSVMW